MLFYSLLFFCFVRNVESCLERFNKQRAHNREPAVDFNHPVIYGMKGKSTWRIDAKVFVVICNFCGLIMHLKGLLIEKIELWRMCNPDSASRLQTTQELGIFLDTWASGLSTQYNAAELKSEYAQLLASMADSDGKNVDLALVPTFVGDFLKSHYTVYYNANVEFEQEEDETLESDADDMVEDENLVPPLEGTIQHEKSIDQGNDEDTESETEVDEQPPIPTEAIGTATDTDNLTMKFCSEAVDLPELGSPMSSSGLGSAFNSPRQFKSAPSLGSLGVIDENEEVQFGLDVAGSLNCMADEDFSTVFGTPEVHRLVSGTGQLKESSEAVTLALLECPSAGTWEQKHIPLQETVPLAQHPVQQSLFNSFVEVVEGMKPLQTHKGVSSFTFIESCTSHAVVQTVTRNGCVVLFFACSKLTWFTLTHAARGLCYVKLSLLLILKLFKGQCTHFPKHLQGTIQVCASILL